MLRFPRAQRNNQLPGVKVPRGRPSRAAIHERLEMHVTELRTRLGGLPLPEEAEEIWSQIWHQEAHHSTAL